MKIPLSVMRSGQSDPSPEVFEHIDIAVGPGIDHAQRRARQGMGRVSVGG